MKRGGYHNQSVLDSFNSTNDNKKKNYSIENNP
jgi:hypothetical protein